MAPVGRITRGVSTHTVINRLARLVYRLYLWACWQDIRCEMRDARTVHRSMMSDL